MPVELTSPVEGLAVGSTYTGPRERWLVEQGYAKRSSGSADRKREDSPEVEDKQPAVTGDFRYATSVKASEDPTLAENREKPNEPTPHEADPEVTGPAATQLPSIEQTRGRPDPSTLVPSGGNSWTADDDNTDSKAQAKQAKAEAKAAEKAAKDQRKAQENEASATS